MSEFDDRDLFGSLSNDFEKRTPSYDPVDWASGFLGRRVRNWLGSISYSGHIRERCLRELISAFLPGDENRIMLRLEDWVPQIRLHARKWILSDFRSLSEESIHRNQRLILYLSGKEALRGDPALLEIHRELIARAAAMTSREFGKFDPRFRRLILGTAIDLGQTLLPLILEDRDPANRSLVFNLPGTTQLTGDEMDRLRRDKSVAVRRRFFLWRLKSQPMPPEEELLGLAMDPNRSIRSLGQFHLKKHHGVDAYAIYRSLTDERSYFITDYAREEDADRFIEGIRHGSGRVRTSCLRALAACDEGKLRELDLSELILANRRQRMIITASLARIMDVAGILALEGTFRKISPDGDLIFLRLLERKSYWHFLDRSLGYILANESPNAVWEMGLRIRAQPAIRHSLPPQLRDGIEAKLRHLENRSPELVEHVRFTMKHA